MMRNRTGTIMMRNTRITDKEEKEEGTNAAEVDNEMLEETDPNKKRKAKDDNSNKKGKLPTRGRKVGV